MNVDNFLVFDRLKNKLSFWRIISVILLILVIKLSLTNNYFVNHNKNNNDYIAKININGEIDENLFSEKKLKELEEDENLKAVILEIDSPGGYVTESEILYTFFKKLSKKVPVVTTVRNLCASGAYLIALASEYIVGYNTSEIGSIGVLLQTINVNNVLDKIGVDVKLYKTSKLKSSPNMFERIDEDVNAMVEDQMNEVYNYFLDVFIENRKIDRKNALDLANGQVYIGKQAVNFGLIDKIGNIDNLLDYLNKKGIKTDNIVDYDISKSENNLINKFIRKNYKNSIANNKKLLLLYN